MNPHGQYVIQGPSNISNDVKLVLKYILQLHEYIIVIKCPIRFNKQSKLVRNILKYK